MRAEELRCSVTCKCIPLSCGGGCQINGCLQFARLCIRLGHLGSRSLLTSPHAEWPLAVQCLQASTAQVAIQAKEPLASLGSCLLPLTPHKPEKMITYTAVALNKLLTAKIFEARETSHVSTDAWKSEMCLHDRLIRGCN